MDDYKRYLQSEIKMAASKHVAELVLNGVSMLRKKPKDHTFTSGHSQQ
jgi:hypothetical protein